MRAFDFVQARPVRIGVLLVAMPVFLWAQQRDAAVLAPGTGEITGTTVGADGTGQPLSRAVVTLSGGGPARSVMSDDAGVFVFGKLPAGTFSITARKAGYIAAPYGAKGPGRTGTAVALGNGQHTRITITMSKGAVIAGMLRDAAGQPLSGQDVRAIDARTLAVVDSSPPELATTDDRGIYRIFGLLPGEYVVIALPGAIGGEIDAPSSSDLDSSLAALASRSAAAPGMPAATPPPATPPRTVGFAPIFYPGSPYYVDALRVRVAAAEERTGVDFQVAAVPVSSIEGTVAGNGANPATLQVTIIPTTPRVTTFSSSASMAGRAIDAQGTFRYANLPPGRYRIVARGQRGDVDAPSTPTLINGVALGRAGGGGAPPTPVAGQRPASGEYLFGQADVEVRGNDLTGVSITLQPAGVITGRFVFNRTGAAAPPADLSRMTASVSLEGAYGSVSNNGVTMGTSLLSQSSASAKADGSFEIRGIGPGRFIPKFSVPADASKVWKLRSAISGDRDLLDDAIEMGLGTEIRNVTVVFSDVVTELNGSLQSSAGQLTTDYYVILLPADRSLWHPKSRRIFNTRPATDGRFVFSNVLAGEYVLAAVNDLDVLDLLEPTFLEQIAPSGIKIAIGEGETKTQNIRIR